MPYTRSKYTKEMNQKWSVEAMITLSDSRREMSVDEIQKVSPLLSGLTPQKLSRILNELWEKGFILKYKGTDGRMRYRAVGTE